MSMVIDRMNVHYNYAKKNYNEDNIVGLFLVGSQNYGTDTENSDIDTKLIIAPTLSDIYKNKQGESTTKKIPDSQEQMSVKDIRTMLSELKKQNVNMLEILFTDYFIINPIYADSWQKLIDNRDLIVRYDPILAAKTTKGMSMNSYKRLYNDEGHVNPKYVANLVRLEYYLKQYINQKPYEECLRPTGEIYDYIIQIRSHTLGDASLSTIADSTITSIRALSDAYVQNPNLNVQNPVVDDLFNEVCKEVIDTAFFIEYARNGEL